MAEGTTIFAAVIKAVDQFSGPLKAIAARVRGLGAAADAVGAHGKGMAKVLKAAFGEAEHSEHGAAEGAHKVGAELHKTGEAAKQAGHEIEHAAHHGHGYDMLSGHISLLRTHFGNLGLSLGEVGRSISEFLPAMAGLGAAAGLVGLFEMTEHAAETFSLLSNSARQVGMSAQQFAVFSEVAKTVDVPVTNMTTSMFRLNRVIGDAATGRNKDAAALFSHLGISLRDAAGHMRAAGDLLPQLAAAFQRTHDPAMQARMAMALFGREGMELLPLLTQGSAKLDELSAAARRVVFVPQGEQAEQLEEYHASLLNLTAAVQGMVTMIGTKLAPVLKPVVDLATRWVVANRAWIGTKIAEYVKQLAIWLSALHLEQIIGRMGSWIRHTIDLVDHFGGLTTILGAFALVVASPMIASVLGIVNIVMRLTAVLRVLSALAWSNPILIAVGAVAAAAYEIYDNWGPIKQFFITLWAGVKTAFNEAWVYIKPIIAQIERAARFVEGLRGMLRAPADLSGSDLHHDARPFRPGLPAPLHWGAAPTPLPRLYHPSGFGAPPVTPTAGRVSVDINVLGLPEQSVVRTRTGGNVDLDRVDVGQSFSTLVGAY